LKLARPERALRICHIVDHTESRGGHVVSRHERFSKRLARLEASGRRRWSEDQSAAFGEPICHSQAQRDFRSDHREIDLLLLGERDEFVRT
jgi:hypothetical protein